MQNEVLESAVDAKWHFYSRTSYLQWIPPKITFITAKFFYSRRGSVDVA